MNIYIKAIIKHFFYTIWYSAKYRKKVFDEIIDITLKEICEEISSRYEINFIEIGNDEDHVHFLVQSVPTISLTKIVTIIKSITAREIFKKHPEIKKELWGDSLWTSGYYGNTEGQYANEEIIRKYVKNQGKVYNKIYQGQLNMIM